MTKIFLKFHNLFLVFVLLTKSQFLMDQPVDQAQFIGFARVLSFFRPLPTTFYPILYILTVSLLLITLFVPKLSLRFLATFLFLVTMFITLSYGKVFHSSHIWLVSSLLVCFLNPKKSIAEKNNLLILRLMQATLLSYYFTAGLWKLRDLGLSNWGRALQEQIAYSIAEGTGPGSNVQALFSLIPSWLLSLGFILVVGFQLSSIWPIIKLQSFKMWGVFAFFFHLSTGVFLGVWFVPTMIAVLFFLIMTEDLLVLDSSSSKPLS